MRQWGIRRQVLILTLLPALLIALVLTVYFTLSQLNYISNALERHGRTIASQMSLAAEYAVFSGNIDSLRNILNHTLMSDRDVIKVTITNDNDESLLSLAVEPQEKRYPGYLYTMLSDRQVLYFRRPILTEQLDIDDFENSGLTDSNTNTVTRAIGYVDLYLTTQYSSEQKIKSLIQGGLIALAILLTSALLAIRLSRQISHPIQLLTAAVKKIAAGRYDAHIQQDAPVELAVLESCINSMADELRTAQTGMESRINEFTQELQQTLEELEIRNAELDITRFNAMQASKAKSEFLANMSHEIRTPLSGIMGFTELLINSELENHQLDYAKTIHKSAINLLTIIDDILDLSKIESGKLEIMLTSCNIIDIVEDVIDLLAPIAYEKNLELFYYLDKDVPHIVESDPIRLRQVLLNLVGNAVKFTLDGYVFLKIEPEPDASADTIRFTVSDTGIGMDQNSKQKLFTAFTQADTSITRDFGGTGLGLVISRKLILLMKGDIGFDSTEGEGSSFWFKIPVKVIERSVESIPDDLNGKNIAIVDDHILCRKAIRTMIEQWECSVSEYSFDRCFSENCFTNSDSYDAVVFGISRANMNDIDKYKQCLARSIARVPVMTVVSTRSYSELGQIDSENFGNLVFTTARRAQIQKSLVDTLNQSYSATAPPSSTINQTHVSLAHPSLKVLVVDDNEINLRLAEIILKKNNYDVTTVCSGDDSINMAKNNDFDLVFMDIHMPGLDGYEAAKRIREVTDKRPRPTIIALTANAMPQEIEKVESSGMDDILIKPISEQLISEVILEWFSDSKKEAHQSRIPHAAVETTEVFSPEQAKNLANGNMALAIELFNMLIKELPEHRSGIRQAIADNNIDHLREVTHKLNGASRCCGTTALSKAAQLLESSIDKHEVDKIAKRSASLLKEIDKLQAYQLPKELTTSA